MPDVARAINAFARHVVAEGVVDHVRNSGEAVVALEWSACDCRGRHDMRHDVPDFCRREDKRPAPEVANVELKSLVFLQEPVVSARHAPHLHDSCWCGAVCSLPSDVPKVTTKVQQNTTAKCRGFGAIAPLRAQPGQPHMGQAERLQHVCLLGRIQLGCCKTGKCTKKLLHCQLPIDWLPRSDWGNQVREFVEDLGGLHEI
mmetsp:Transcript_18177/g.31681  ORF Transcript_18177/g.31681 Transcript_18177/m.31681 type:complete len:201 (-) Transcript_18177:27-629(-)